MLDIRALRENPGEFKKRLKTKNFDPKNIDIIISKDAEWRQLQEKINQLKSTQNSASKKIGQAKKSGEDASSAIAEMQELSQKIKDQSSDLKLLEDELKSLLISVPNIPSETAPVGKNEEFNVVCRTWGEKKNFDFAPKTHLEIAEKLDILDFPRGGKVSGSGFPVYKGAGARLERAMINYFLDTHIEKNGFTEVFPPFLVNRESMIGTGQLPKLENDMYYINEDELFLVPTAEVPITNLHRDEILKIDQLPIKYAGYSACFRREAGSYGKDTRGFLRVHQFNKVEMVQFVLPEESYKILEIMVGYATDLLEDLGITYKVLELATGDLSFASSKCYDLEVWAPGENNWLEASSVSIFEDFQARRANIKFRREPNSKPEFVHTLNGSGLATSRVIVAILETYQNEDGSVTVPSVLRPYMGGMEVIN